MSGTVRVSGWLSRPVMGLLVVVGMVVALQVPISWIRSLIWERVATRDAASAEIAGTWGGVQSVIGPRLVVPYTRAAEGGTESGFVNVLPTTLDVDGDVEARPLERGLFTIPVYEAALRIRGAFDRPDLGELGLADADLAWGAATLVVEISDPRSVGGGSAITWNGTDASFLPGAPGSSDRRGIHAAVTMPSEGPVAFTMGLDLKGTHELWLVPFSRETRVDLTSDWPHPSFSGAWLPGRREVGADGFEASWVVPFLGRDYPQVWLDSSDPHERIVASRFGVAMVTPVDHYRMSERSTKYAALFLALTFGLLWIFDSLTGVRVHPVQYLMVGAAVSLFYLLELSLAEHLGFLPAYVIAALGVVGLVAGYTRAVLRSTLRGAAVAGALGLLYAYLLALLSLERYALLAGSLGLFTLLAVVMYLTRWIDWQSFTPNHPPTPA